MASILPEIATAVCDLPTVILDDVRGVLGRPNDIESLSLALVTLLQDAGQCNRLGNAAQTRVEKQFSTQRTSEDYLPLNQ